MKLRSRIVPTGRALAWLGASLGLASVVVWWADGQEPPAPSTRLEPGVATVRPAAANPSAAPSLLPTLLAKPPVMPAVVCTGAPLVLSDESGRRETWCTKPRRVRGSTEMHVHELDVGAGASAWTLRVESSADAVYRVLLTGPRGERLGCVLDEGGCSGAHRTPATEAAAGRIALQNTVLRPLPPKRPKGLRAADMTPADFQPDAAVPPVRVSVELEDADVDGDMSACVGPPVTLVSSRGWVKPFCGDAGHEQGHWPGGGQWVGFLDRRSAPLRVRVGDAGQVLRVELGALSCEDQGCHGTAIEDADNGLRHLVLAGTSLQRLGQDGTTESVALNGRLPMP